MSALYCRDFADAGQRTIGLITLLPAEELQPVVTRFLHNPAACFTTNIDINRDKSTGVTAYEWTVSVRLNHRRSAADEVKEIIGADFLDRHLPITDRAQMPRTGDAFLRIGSFLVPGKHPTLEELFVISEMLNKNGGRLGQRQLECTEAYEHLRILYQLNSSKEEPVIAANSFMVGKLAKKYDMEGGSWLLYADDRQHNLSKQQKVEQCMMAFTKIVMEFFDGSLQDDYITRVNYATVKEVVKVTNKKTKYFDFVERDDPMTAEEKFRADTQVKDVFLKMANLSLGHTKLKYKPEIFTVWKLNTDKTRAVLTIYNDIMFLKKKELASAGRNPHETPAPK